MMNNNYLMNQDFMSGGVYRAFIIKRSDSRVFIPGLCDKNILDSNGDISNEEFEKVKKTLPLALYNSPEIEKLLDDKPTPCFVAFENGNMKRPIVIGYFGKGVKSVPGSTGFSNSNGNASNTQDTPTKIYKVNTAGYIYPLSIKHTQDPFSGGRQFGASRSNGNRAHAGIDLIVPSGTEVIAITDGVVNYISYGFYAGTDAIITKNADGSWFTYGELTPLVKEGSSIIKGQVIGKIKANNSSGASMLHFETYKGDFDSNVLNNNGNSYLYVPNKNYKRRVDLLDPSYVVELPMVK